MSPEQLQAHMQRDIDAQTIERLQERNANLHEALEVATNWLSDDRHPIGWSVERLRFVLTSPFG
jgi:hypothetical protein